MEKSPNTSQKQEPKIIDIFGTKKVEPVPEEKPKGMGAMIWKFVKKFIMAHITIYFKKGGLKLLTKVVIQNVGLILGVALSISTILFGLIKEIYWVIDLGKYSYEHVKPLLQSEPFSSITFAIGFITEIWLITKFIISIVKSIQKKQKQKEAERQKKEYERQMQEQIKIRQEQQKKATEVKPEPPIVEPIPSTLSFGSPAEESHTIVSEIPTETTITQQ